MLTLSKTHEPTSPPNQESRSSRQPNDDAVLSKTRLARVAGVLYLLVALLGGFSQLYVRPTVIEAGDAVATAQNIASSPALFRLGFVTDLVSITLFLLVALALYTLLKPIGAALASAMVIFNAVAVAVMSVNMINHAAAYLVATSVDHTAALGADASAAQVLLFLDLHSQGYLIAEIFFGLWLIPLGLLVSRSGYFPRPLGILLIVGAASYLVDVALVLLFPGAGESLSLLVAVPAGIAEVVFLFWLLAKGIGPQLASRTARSVS